MSGSDDDTMPALQRESSTEETDRVESEIAAAQARLTDDPERNIGACKVPNPGAGTEDATDEDEDEEEKPYGKKAVKKMMEKMNKEVDMSFADALEADEDGYKPITWTQLSDAFSYERVAHGFKLFGDISQKDREHWERSKQVKIRDRDGREGAVFFYDEESKPYFDWDDVQVGNEIVVKSPRFHRFLDGQEGMRIESNKCIARVAKRRFTDVQRLDYGRLNKTNGNTKYGKKKYDDAIQCYETAINHLRGTFHEHPEFEQEAKELTAQCYLNIAACQIGQERHRVVEVACRSALRINANAQLNAKAYFRIGQAALKLHELQPAREALLKALELAPGDPAVCAEIEKLNEAISADAKAQKELYDLKKKDGDRKFGLRRTVLTSEVPTSVDGVANFRDVGGKTTCPAGTDPETRVPRFILYRSAHLNDITKSGMRVLADELRIKSILDLRTASEIKASKARTIAAVKAFNSANELEIALYKKSDGARGIPERVHVDIHSKFAPVEVKCKPDTDAELKPAKGHPLTGNKALSEITEGPVCYQVDMTTRAVFALASWWTLVQAIFWGILAFFYSPLLRVAARVMIQGTALRVGVEEFYQTTLRLHGPEIKFAMELASKEANYPILVHCSMGKDRTGIIVALLLAVAGVPEEVIAAEYAAVPATNPPDDAEWKPLGLDDNWKVARRETMEATLRAVKDKYGSVAAYLDSIGVSEETRAGVKAALSKVVTKRR